MLFQPSNIAPSTLSGIGIGTVDVTQGLDVSWQVNGDSPMTDYQITIYQNDSNSTQMYTTGQITLGTPFQPHDAQGNPQFFSTTISAATLASANIVNGYVNGYKIIIKQWWSVSESVEQTSAAVFITRATPTLSIDAIPSPVTTNTLTITATYAQAQGDPVSTVEWVLALAGQEDTPIKETGAVSTQVLSFTADGLITGNTYSVMCNVVTSNGVEVSTGFVQFSVSYPSSSISVNYQLAQMRNSSAAYLSWDAFGANVLSYPYEDSTKTTNGITFTVNGEGDISASGTASADAYFKLVEGTIANLAGISVGQKLLITSGYSGAKIEVKETNSSNVVVSTITGSDPLQYIVPSTSNTLTISIVIPNGSVLSPAVTLSPMLYAESSIVSATDVSVSMLPIQSLNGYSAPWPAGGGANKFDLATAFTEGETVTDSGIIATFSNGMLHVTGTNTGGSAFNIVYKTISGTLGAGTYICGEHATVRASVDSGSNTNYSSSFTATSSVSFVAFYVAISANATNIDWNIPMMVVSGTTRPTTYAPYSNICPITGRTGVTVYRTGKNILDNDNPTAENASNIVWGGPLVGNADGTFVLAAGTYTISVSENMNGIYVEDDTGATIKTVYNTTTSTFTLSASTVVKVKFYKAGATDMGDYLYQLEIGSTATTYEAYVGANYSSDWTSTAGTVYAGTVDPVTGVLTVDRATVDLGSLNWVAQAAGHFMYSTGIASYVKAPSSNDTVANILCSTAESVSANAVDTTSGALIGIVNNGNIRFRYDGFSNYPPQFKSDVSGMQLVYELATPVTYQLSKQEITLLTTTNMWSDGGNITVIYTKSDDTQATVAGAIASFNNSKAVPMPTPVFIPGVSGVSIYRYTQGEPILHHVIDVGNDVDHFLDYFAPSQQKLSYLMVAHAATDLFMLTSQFTPVFWFYSILLCSQDANGFYHVRSEYIFKYGVETGTVSNNNSPSLQTNFTRYPTRQPINSLYKTGTLKGYIGTVSGNRVYSDSVSLQNAIYEISTSTLTKFLKTRKGETIMVECSSPIQMQTGDNMVQQPLVATIDWVEVGDCSDDSIISVPSDSFWPL